MNSLQTRITEYLRDKAIAPDTVIRLENDEHFLFITSVLENNRIKRVIRLRRLPNPAALLREGVFEYLYDYMIFIRDFTCSPDELSPPAYPPPKPEESLLVDLDRGTYVREVVDKSSDPEPIIAISSTYSAAGKLFKVEVKLLEQARLPGASQYTQRRRLKIVNGGIDTGPNLNIGNREISDRAKLADIIFLTGDHVISVTVEKQKNPINKRHFMVSRNDKVITAILDELLAEF